jgi:hypothetical protein
MKFRFLTEMRNPMDENHQDKTESKTPATEGQSLLSPLSSQDQQRPARPQNNQMEDVIKHLRDRGYKVTEEYNDTGQLSKVSGEDPPRKTLWDWLQLLIIPLLIAGLGIGFTWVQNQTSLQIAKDNRAQDLQIAKDTQEEATLKAYLDDMTTLLLDKKLGSQDPRDQVASAEAAVIAQAKTLTTLRRLTDPDRKSILVRFLSVAGLVGGSHEIISLSGTDLSRANLRYATLVGATPRELISGKPTSIEPTSPVPTSVVPTSIEPTSPVPVSVELSSAILTSAEPPSAMPLSRNNNSIKFIPARAQPCPKD